MQDTIIGRFSKYLTEIKYPKQEASWNIAGIIRGHNGFYKFDVRDMFKLSDGTSAQKGRTDSMADKMVLEMKYQWKCFILGLPQWFKATKNPGIKDLLC